MKPRVISTVVAIAVLVALTAHLAGAAPPGKPTACSVYLRGAATKVTFSTRVIPAVPGSTGHGVGPFDCVSEAKTLTSHNVGSSPFTRNHSRWTVQPHPARRALVCLFHEAWLGSTLTVTVSDSSGIVLPGDTCAYLLQHA